MSLEQVRKTLDTLIHESGSDYAAISRLLGRNPAYIQQFIKRGIPRRLKEDDRRRLARYFGVDERLLGAPHDSPATSGASYGPAPQNTLDDDNVFVFIPYFDIRASAGAGSFVDREDAQGSLAFRREWITQVANGSTHDLAVLKVEGDSMHPTLAHGDHILIDRSQSGFARDGIYVLRVDGALLVKRISVNPSTKKLTIRSDNQAYESWSDCDPTQVDLLGRVIWVGRRL